MPINLSRFRKSRYGRGGCTTGVNVWSWLELRTPLAVQRTLIEVGLAGLLTGDQLDLLTRQLLATNERNEGLIEGLLVLAEAEQAPIGHSPLKMDEVVTSVVDLHLRTSPAGPG